MFSTNSQLKTELAQMREAFAALETEHSTLSEQFSSLRSERDGLVHQLSDLAAAKTDLEKVYAATLDELAEAEAAQTDFEARVNAGITAGLAAISADPVPPAEAPKEPDAMAHVRQLKGTEKLSAIFKMALAN